MEISTKFILVPVSWPSKLMGQGSETADNKTIKINHLLWLVSNLDNFPLLGGQQILLDVGCGVGWVNFLVEPVFDGPDDGYFLVHADC